MQSSRETTEIAARRADVAARYLRGDQQPLIAEAWGVDQATISRDLKAIRTAWLKSAIRDFDEAKAQELAKIDEVEREYWAAWRRSQQPRRTAMRERKDGKRNTRVTREGQAGNAVFLDGVLRCIAKRCEILGLDAPKRFIINWDDLTPEQEDRLARGEDPAKVLAA